MPWLVLAAIAGIVLLAVARLPGSFLAQYVRDRPFSAEQAGWAFRLLALAALLQAAYGGFVLLQTERVQKAMAADPRTREMGAGRLMDVLTRNAVLMVGLTIVYGLAALAMTGERGGFWLFALIALAQAGWYFHQLGRVGDWLGRQAPAPPRASSGDEEAPQAPPPIAEGLSAGAERDAGSA